MQNESRVTILAFEESCGMSWRMIKIIPQNGFITTEHALDLTPMPSTAVLV